MRTIKIFISYAKEDFNKAFEIYDFLKKSGYDPWLDQEKILPAQEWEFEISKAIESADFFLACLSKDSVDKIGFVQKELKKGLEFMNYRLDGKIYIIPVRIDDCPVPSRFKKLQRLDIFNNNWQDPLVNTIEQGIKELGLSYLAFQVLKGPDSGRNFKLFSPSVVIGRTENRDICLNDDSVSSLHAKIELRGKRLLYRHLSETKSSIIESKTGAIQLDLGRNESQTLNDGDIIKLGNTQLRLSAKNISMLKDIATTKDQSG